MRMRARANQATPENATKRCDFYSVGPGAARAVCESNATALRLQGVLAQRLHEAGAAGARAQRRLSLERVAHDHPQAELGDESASRSAPPAAAATTPVTHSACGRSGAAPTRRRDRAGHPRGRARLPGHVRRDLRAGGLVLQRRRRVRRDADVGAPGVHCDEQAALCARHDAERRRGRAGTGGAAPRRRRRRRPPARPAALGARCGCPWGALLSPTRRRRARAAEV